jgi:hypothetical protein
LQVDLDAPLPAELAVGSGTALFVHGTCFDPAREICSLSFLVDGAEQPVSAHGMPRRDRFRALHPRLDRAAARGPRHDPDSPEDAALRSYHSGFWGLAKIAAPAGPAVELRLRARLRGGGEEEVPLGRLAVASPPRALPVRFPDERGAGGGPRVAVCMATHDPPLDLLHRQLDSLRAQTHANWVCVISDDCSRPDAFAAIDRAVGSDPRFALSRSPRRLGFYGNFERALWLAPRECDYVALADQDDVWHPDKLAVLLEAIDKATLVYSDARIVARGGQVIASTYWARRRNNHTDIGSLLMANSVTGAASLLRRELLDHALPFPPGQFAHYHDHWLGLVALALGEVRYVDRPLYDYVQHGTASLGHAGANRITPLGARLARLRDDPRQRVRVSRTRYFVDVVRLEAFATILLMRCGERMEPARRRRLERFLALERSWPALAWLAGRAVRELLRSTPETLGAEWELLQALLWRRAIAATARWRRGGRSLLDALPPPDLAPRAGPPRSQLESVRVVAEKIAPLELAVSDRAPRRVNLLIPTIDLEHLFGGYIAKFNLARRLAERGACVRLVTVDPVGPLPRDWRARIASYSGLERLFERVEVAFGRGSGRLEVSRADALIATTWWTAHIAQAALAELGRRGFLYLVQEYEPFTFAMGSYAALARQSYDFEHFALFSTELLREYFRRHRLGVYAAGERAGAARSASFDNAITAIEAPHAARLAGRANRRLLFYARPEPHAARNMFELGVLALERALADGALHPGWELHGIGGLGPRRRIGLAAGAELELMPRAGEREYARLLGEHDVGLALMYTPHPSLVPIEMACAGLLTVTNTFENKTAEVLRAISGNLIPAEPTVEGIAAALAEAAAAAGDLERRIAGAAVRWSREWESSFGDELLARVEAYLASA